MCLFVPQDQRVKSQGWGQQCDGLDRALRLLQCARIPGPPLDHYVILGLIWQIYRRKTLKSILRLRYISEIVYAKGLAQGLAHKDSISSRGNYHPLPTQETFLKCLLYVRCWVVGLSPFSCDSLSAGREACRGTVTCRDSISWGRGQQLYSAPASLDKGQ